MWRVTEVKTRHDPCAVEYLVTVRFKLLKTRPDQLHDCVFIELRAEDRHGDEAAVAALVDAHVGDAEWQQLRQQRYLRVRSGLRLAADQYEIGSRLGGGNDGHLIGLERSIVDGVKQERRRGGI